MDAMPKHATIAAAAARSTPTSSPKQTSGDPKEKLEEKDCR